MSVRLVVTGTAARQLAERLPESAATACVEFLFGPLADDPHRVGAPLRAPFAGQWRARRGEYRARYRIDDTNRIVYVLDVDHRSSLVMTMAALLPGVVVGALPRRYLPADFVGRPCSP